MSQNKQTKKVIKDAILYELKKKGEATKHIIWIEKEEEGNI